MITNLLYYISDETNPYINLSIEKYLLDMVDENTHILYLWQNKNTVVIGKNQNPWAECRCSLLEQDGGLLARRLSGGGAVFHDLGNVNFTFLYSEENHDIERNMKIIQKACALEGIRAEISGRNDITVNGKKFSGNAFYNSKGKCYHHGTLLVCADKEKMQKYLTPPKAKLISKGVKSVGARVVNLTEISPTMTIESIKANIIKAFNEIFNLSAKEISDIDMDFVNTLAKEYGSWDYLFGKTIDFSVSLEDHFDWGHIQILLDINDGIITNVQTYTDALDSSLPEMLEKSLIGLKYKLSLLSESLSNNLSPDIFQDIFSLFENKGF